MIEYARPLDMLNANRNKRVMVELKSGKIISGILKAFDIYINIVLEDVEETSPGDEKNPPITKECYNIFIRGDTINFISTEK